MIGHAARAVVLLTALLPGLAVAQAPRPQAAPKGPAVTTTTAPTAASKAAPAATPVFRVGGFIENGFLGDPKGWELKGFASEKGNWISVKGVQGHSGTATTTFKGPEGFYTLRVRYFDEGDGVSTAQLKVNDKVVGYWKFDGILVDTWAWQEFEGVRLKAGDRITLAGRGNVYEYCRLQGMEVLPGKAPPVREGGPAGVERRFSTDLVPLADHRAVSRAEDFIPPLRSIYSGSAGTYYLYVRRAGPLRLVFSSTYTGYPTTVDYSLTLAGQKDPVVRETISSTTSDPIYVRPALPEPGLYLLKADVAPGVRTGSVNVAFDVPGVAAVPGAGRFFYVPQGTPSVGVQIDGRAILLDAKGRALLDEWDDGKALRWVPVPPGADDQVWMVQGTLKKLAGVPPYVATTPERLLTPIEAVKEGPR